MKRSELVVGQDLYLAAGVNWKQQHYSGQKVTVMETEPYYDGYNGPVKTTKGSGVLVSKGSQSRYLVVQLAALRGDYETINAEQKERLRLRDIAADKRAEEDQQRRNTANKVIADALLKGVKVNINHRRSTGTLRVEMDVAVFEAMLDALPEGFTIPAKE